MQLSTFITAHLEKILFEWDAFARTLFPASPAPPHHILRDHAGEILQEIVVDLDTHQTAQQQTEKSKGQLDENVNKKSAAAIHGTMRQASGFTLTQLTAEYRALRATVLRLWLPHMQLGTPESATDMMRFNEAMDQALAESVVTYSENADRTRDTFLAILGHDLRSPLFTMKLAGSFLMRPAIGTEATRETGARVARSAANMTAMVNDLLEYARTQLGSGIPLTQLPENITVDLGEVVRGGTVHTGDIKLPKGIKLVMHGRKNLTLATVVEPVEEVVAAPVVAVVEDKKGGKGKKK